VRDRVDLTRLNVFTTSMLEPRKTPTSWAERQSNTRQCTALIRI
jgi:hypothetical protein